MKLKIVIMIMQHRQLYLPKTRGVMIYQECSFDMAFMSTQKCPWEGNLLKRYRQGKECACMNLNNQQDDIMTWQIG